MKTNKTDMHNPNDDLPEDDSFYEDEDGNFLPCDDCDLPDACSAFGCAIQNGVRKPPTTPGVF